MKVAPQPKKSTFLDQIFTELERFKKHRDGTVPSHKKHRDGTVEKLSGTFHLTHIIQNSFEYVYLFHSIKKNTYSAKYANSTMSTFA